MSGGNIVAPSSQVKKQANGYTGWFGTWNNPDDETENAFKKIDHLLKGRVHQMELSPSGTRHIQVSRHPM